MRSIAILCLLLVASSVAHAATLPANFTETTITGIASPTAMEIAPNGRIFVCEQTGRLRVIKNGVLLFVTNLDLAPGENSSAVTARAQDAAVNVFR